MTGDERPERRTRRHPDHDDRKQPFARFLAVDVVGERPELRDQRDVEDADPDEERDADEGDARRYRHREQLDADDEEQGDADEQPGPIDAVGEPAVQRHEPDQDQRLAGCRIGSDFGASAEENQRLPDGLDDRVADEQQKNVRQHQQGRRAFAGPNVGEDRERAVQPGFPGSARHRGCEHVFSCFHVTPKRANRHRTPQCGRAEKEKGRRTRRR